jgi:hypothetical protein
MSRGDRGAEEALEDPLPVGKDGTLVSDFRVECFTSDFNQAMVGIPPHPPMPPFPITISMQARRRAADESVEITVTDFSVILIRSL